jgi:hypothetical protein
MITGGFDGNTTSDCIHEVQLVPPYTVKTLSRMPEPRQAHSIQLFDDNLLSLVEEQLANTKTTSAVSYCTI